MTSPRSPLVRIVRVFLALEVVSFGAAVLVHSGMGVAGLEHERAAIAESTIAAVLALALLTTFPRPNWSRSLGIAAQGFGLLGTLVGIFTIVIGVGPRSTFDYVTHAVFVALFLVGLSLVARAPRPPEGGP